MYTDKLAEGKDLDRFFTECHGFWLKNLRVKAN
jgi:hypothetical protein